MKSRIPSSKVSGRSLVMGHLFSTILSGLALLSALGLQGAAAEARKPNLLLILSDDQGYGDVGAQGGKDFATPNLDSIALNGILCTAGYVSAPQCAPSRCGLLTGRRTVKKCVRLEH